MAGANEWRQHLIQFELERSAAFGEALGRLRGKDYGTQLPRKLILYLERANGHIAEQLESLLGDQDFAALEDSEAEQQILRYSLLYTYLNHACTLVDRSEAGERNVIAMVMPLRRILTAQLGEVDILLFPLPEINYSFFPLGRNLREVLGNLGINDVPELPDNLYAIAFAGLHGSQFLLHSLLAHEVGHALYSELQLESTLIPLVPKNDARLDEYAGSISRSILGQPSGSRPDGEGTSQVPEVFSEVRLKAYLNREITETFQYWVKEIASDAIAFYVMGLPFLFSAIYFLPILHQLDNSTKRYPPTRTRLRLMFRLFNWSVTGSVQDFDGEEELQQQVPAKVVEFLRIWSAVSVADIVPDGGVLHTVARDAVQNAFDQLAAEIRGALSAIDIYCLPQHKAAVEALRARMMKDVPPNELDTRTGEIPEFACILNAGWLSLLSDVDDITARHGWSAWRAKSAIHDWTAKAVESQEVTRRWREIASLTSQRSGS